MFRERLIYSLILLSLFSPQAWTCDRAISFGYGPYISLSMLNIELAEIHRQVESLTGCPVSFQAYSKMEQLTEDILKHKHQFVLIPNVFYSELKDEGYTMIASLKKRSHSGIYIFTHRDVPIFELSQLKNRSVAILANHSASGIQFRLEMERLNLTDQIHIKVVPSYERITMKVLQNQVDAGVIVGTYWNRLDPNIRQDSLRIIERLTFNSRGGYMVRNQDKTMGEEIGKFLIRSNPDFWSIPETLKQSFPEIQGLIKRIKQNQDRAVLLP